MKEPTYLPSVLVVGVIVLYCELERRDTVPLLLLLLLLSLE